MPDETDADLVDALRTMPRERPISRALEENTVRALHDAGVLRRGMTQSPVRRWALVAAIALVAFIGGRATARSRDVPTLPQASFALLLYGGSTADSAAHAVRAAEYTAWVRAPKASGRVVGGEALDNEATVVRVAGDVSGPTDIARGSDALVGYFLVQAADRAAALRIARECPHLKYGGRVEVRALLPT